MSEEIQFAQTHFREALRKVNPQSDPVLHSLIQGLTLLAQAFAHLESKVETIHRAVQAPKP